MTKTSKLFVAAVFALTALFALAGPASAQDPAVDPDAYVAGVTTIAPAPAPAAAPAAEVLGASQVQPAGALPYTGGNSLPMIQIGIALVAVGAIATFAVRRRNAAERL